MSLENGILGYLSIKPLSGYDIKKLFNMSAAYFWPADQAQIYRSLKKLVEDKLVELTEYEHGETVNKKIYTITPKGRETVRKWILATDVSDYIIRASSTMQLFFSGMLTREEQISFLDAQIENNAALLQSLRENYRINSSKFHETADIPMNDPRFQSAVFAHRWGVVRCEAYAKFLEETKAEILAKSD